MFACNKKYRSSSTRAQLMILALCLFSCGCAVERANSKAKIARAKTDVNGLSMALHFYYQDFSKFPGPAPRTQSQSDLGTVLAQLLSTSNGTEYLATTKGIVVRKDSDSFVPATPAQLKDPSLEKFLLDPWGNPYRYRNNSAATTKVGWMIRPDQFDLWSAGPNGVDESAAGRNKECDDIGNWD